MPVVKIERILSVNSADPAYPAENLLTPDNNKKWKCKKGEKQASVILQLKEDTVIDGIDIGNENSAFVEVLVGKSSSRTDDFKVLLVASVMMTLKDSKDGTNTNGVRFFKKDNLTKPTAEEKWDRIKIVCTQPFNKNVQYGLSFVVFHSPNDQVEEEEGSGSLGRFTLKQEEKEQPMAIGSWFAKRKDPAPPVPPGAAASIRDASSPAVLAKGKNMKPKKPTPKRNKPTPKNGALNTPKVDVTPSTNATRIQKPMSSLNSSIGDEDSPADDTDADSTYSPNKDSTSVLSDDDIIPEDEEEDDKKRDKRLKRKLKDNTKNVLNGNNLKRKVDDNNGDSKTKVAKIARTTIPFGRLLEGVTIVISGYQNPLRGELRSKACALGAKYKADWDNTCTHLICAFVNTPKFNQVRGRGKIVKKEWIEECHSCRRRLPWRRFALDRNDAGTSSEDEVWEEGSIPSTSSNNNNVIASGVNRRRVSSGSGSDTEEEIERVRARQAANKPGSPNKLKAKVEESKKPIKTPNKNMKDDPFGVDTDVDSGSESQTAHLPLPPLPEFFENIAFHIAPDIDDTERNQLKRYITAYKGSIMDVIDANVEYVITKLPDVAAEVGEEYGISGVTPDWIWECSNANELVPVSDFTL